MNHSNRPCSTWRWGEKKKHKALLASVASTTAPASTNFHTLNIYFEARCVCRWLCLRRGRSWFSIVLTFSFILLITTKDKRLGGLCAMIIARVNFKLFSPSGIVTFL
jgi:hypothetical protein